MSLSLDAWFNVSFDEDQIYWDVRPPGGSDWTAELPWGVIIRVCYLAGDFLSPDEIYIFTSQRPESYVIPTEAHGAAELWGEIVRRGIFDPQKAIEAVTSGEGLSCWPPVEDDS